MVFRTFSGFLQGIEGKLVEVETSVTKGLKSFNIVGLGDKAIEESKERVGSAIKNSSFIPPYARSQRVLINLAPAFLRKEGSVFDLPIALGYLAASRQIVFNPEKKLFVGELALDGRVKPVNGVISFCVLAKKLGFEEVFVPKENEKEAGLVNLIHTQKPLKIFGVESLTQIILFLQKRINLAPFEIKPEEILSNKHQFEIDFSWVRGQTLAKRALEIAAAGSHNVLLEGPPGTGKTLLAKSIVSILPPLSIEEIIEITQIYSAAGLLKKDEILTQRPFRQPHHTCSEVALIGGGNPPKPGEITLAHRGVLFLDEFPEFHRDVLESLRGPLEEGWISLSRAKYHLNLPSKFILIAAANPCPCGYKNHPEKPCVCTASQIASYQRKLSGPLVDRIDLFCYVPSLKYEDLISPQNSEVTHSIRKRIEQARAIQKERFKNEKILTNSEMNVHQIKKYCPIPPQAQRILKKAVDEGKLSARGYFRVLKIARTIADLQEKENISFENVMEAISFKKGEEE